MEKNSDEWEKWCLLEASEKAPMPGEWGKINDFRQLLIIRALKPGRITNALQVSHGKHACTLIDIRLSYHAWTMLMCCIVLHS